MNRERLFTVYNQSCLKVSYMSELGAANPGLFSAEPLAPEFTKKFFKRTASPKAEIADDQSTARSTNFSFCSNFSRMSMDLIIYLGILEKREEHKVFLELEAAEDHQSRLWYYIADKTETIQGPFTPVEMTAHFELRVINGRTQVKRKFEDAYVPLAAIVKRYYRNVLLDRLAFQKGSVDLPRRVMRFKKGNAPKVPHRYREVFEPRTRQERYTSEVVRPNLVDLKMMMPAAFDESVLEPIRARASTNPLRCC